MVLVFPKNTLYFIFSYDTVLDTTAEWESTDPWELPRYEDR